MEKILEAQQKEKRELKTKKDQYTEALGIISKGLAEMPDELQLQPRGIPRKRL